MTNVQICYVTIEHDVDCSNNHFKLFLSWNAVIVYFKDFFRVVNRILFVRINSIINEQKHLWIWILHLTALFRLQSWICLSPLFFAFQLQLLSKMVGPVVHNYQEVGHVLCTLPMTIELASYWYSALLVIDSTAYVGAHLLVQQSTSTSVVDLLYS